MTVYVLQEMGRNTRSAEKFGDLKVCLPDNRQMVLSSGPLTFKLKQELKVVYKNGIKKILNIQMKLHLKYLELKIGWHVYQYFRKLAKNQ